MYIFKYLIRLKVATNLLDLIVFEGIYDYNLYTLIILIQCNKCFMHHFTWYIYCIVVTVSLLYFLFVVINAVAIGVGEMTRESITKFIQYFTSHKQTLYKCRIIRGLFFFGQTTVCTAKILGKLEVRNLTTKWLRISHSTIFVVHDFILSRVTGT